MHAVNSRLILGTVFNIPWWIKDLVTANVSIHVPYRKCYLLNDSRWLFVNSESVFLHACTVHPSVWKDVTTEDYLGGFDTRSAIRHAAKYTWANTVISCHVWEGTVTYALLTCCWHHTDTVWWPDTNAVSPANSYDLSHDKCLLAASP